MTAVVEKLPIGTNLALYQFLWMLISGALHNSRDALFPGLKPIGLTDAEVRRSWAAMRSGSWQTAKLLETWRTYVMSQGEWQASQHAGYYTKAVDITAYWRPTLKGLQSKHYHDEADKVLPAVVFGMVGRVGRVSQQRLALLTDLVRVDLKDPSRTACQTKLLQQVAENLAADEMLAVCRRDTNFYHKIILKGTKCDRNRQNQRRTVPLAGKNLALSEPQARRNSP